MSIRRNLTCIHWHLNDVSNRSRMEAHLQAWDDTQVCAETADLCGRTVAMRPAMLRCSLHVVGHDNHANNQAAGIAHAVKCMV